MGRGCAVPKCKTGYQSVKEKRSVFTAPKNIEQFKKWQAAIPGIHLKPSQSVCEKHFEKKCILREWIKYDLEGRIIAKVPYLHPRLIDGAIPTIFENSTTLMPIVTDEPSDSVCDGSNFLEDKRENIKKSHMGIPNVEYAQTSCAMTQGAIMNQDVLPHEIVDIKSAKFNSSPESFYHKVLPVTEPTGAASLFQNKKVVDPVFKERNKKFLISEITITDLSKNVVTSKENIITIPTSWGVTEYIEEKGQRVIFSNIFRTHANGTIIDKSVEVKADKTLRYYVYGHPINAERCQLPPVLMDMTLLPKALETFKWLNVCQGLGLVNIHHLPIDCVFQDSVQRWRDNDCIMLSKQKRCDNCKKMRQRTLQRESRSNKTDNIHRIRQLSNPIDRRKVIALQMKISREKRVTNYLKRRLHLLT